MLELDENVVSCALSSFIHSGLFILASLSYSLSHSATLTVNAAALFSDHCQRETTVLRASCALLICYFAVNPIRIRRYAALAGGGALGQPRIMARSAPRRQSGENSMECANVYKQVPVGLSVYACVYKIFTACVYANETATDEGEEGSYNSTRLVALFSSSFLVRSRSPVCVYGRAMCTEMYYVSPPRTHLFGACDAFDGE